jgi:hypothetical protein
MIAAVIPMEDAAGNAYARREDVLLRVVAGEQILVPIRNNVAQMQSIFALTGIGAAVWNLLDGVRTLDGVLSAILEQYDIGEEQARNDLQAFVAQLREAGLVERRG